jgi:serine protease Do
MRFSSSTCDGVGMTNETSSFSGWSEPTVDVPAVDMPAVDMPIEIPAEIAHVDVAPDQNSPLQEQLQSPSEYQRARWSTDDTLPGTPLETGVEMPTGAGMPGSVRVPVSRGVPTLGYIPSEAKMPGSAGYPDSGVAANPPRNTGPGAPLAAGILETPRKPSGWAKPAMVGGLVGALLSSAVLGTALVATRQENNKVDTSKASTPMTTTKTAGSTAAPQPVSIIDPKLPPPLKIRELLKAVQPAVVSIATQSGFALNEFAPSGAGTGMVVTADGYILTNNHVIADATTVKVTFSDRKVRNAVVVGTDPTNDVALVKVDAKDLPTVTLGSSKALQVGDQVVAIGNALALPGGPTVTTGIVSALNRTLEGDGETLEGLVQTDAAINPGNSGGPLVNTTGEVVGMNTAIIRNTANIGFSIASDRISPILDKLKKNATAGGDAFKPRTFLGVTMYELTPDMVERFGLGTNKGVLVADVNIGSPADNAGLQAGDVVVQFDGKTVTKSEELKTLVQSHKPGDVVPVAWVTRDGRKMEANIELGAARRASSPALPLPETQDPNQLLP